MSLESHLEEFVTVVEAGSVSAAARELGVPRASVSRRLAKLEAAYGVQLLHRETHRHTLTQAGRELYQRARRIVADMAAAQAAVSALDGVPRGLLRVGMPFGSGIEMLLARAYREAYPQVTLEFVGTGTHDDLLGHGIDVALRSGPIADEALMGRRLIRFNDQVVASPDLLERLGPPTLATLAEYPCILGFDNDGRPVAEWPLWAGGTTPVQSTIRTNDATARIDGARMGMGLTLASERLTRDHVAAGELVPILTEAVGREVTVSLVWPASEFMPPKVRAFVDLAVELIGALAAARDNAQKSTKQ